MRRLCLMLCVGFVGTAAARGHDIPNARVDRSIQATLRPGRLTIDYEVSLSELTLTQDLRSLIGTLPGGDRRDWFDRYGRETGPLNARGMLLTVEGRPVDLLTRGFDLSLEEHPRYTFHFEAEVPSGGTLTIHDTNFAGSEGTSRLALRGLGGVAVEGDELPSDVDQIPIRPVWQLSDVEERRTKQLEVRYTTRPAALPAASLEPPVSRPPPPARSTRVARSRLSGLLDRARGVSLAGLLLVAFLLGAAHAVQPGHGKTLVAATVVGEGGSRLQGAFLALVTTLTHTGSVLLVAAGLGLTESSRFAEVHRGLALTAGYLIAAIGVWRLGRHLAGLGEHEEPGAEPGSRGLRGLVGLGVAGGLVPCWDAVGLILLADAVGRLALGVALLLAFGLGMALVLVAVGWAAARFRTLSARGGPGSDWERPLGLASSLALSAIGVYLWMSA